MKNILIISSSPRKRGNSQLLCEEFKRGAEEKRQFRNACPPVRKENRLLQSM